VQERRWRRFVNWSHGTGSRSRDTGSREKRQGRLGSSIFFIVPPSPIFWSI
jgi:hypothetical protein